MNPRPLKVILRIYRYEKTLEEGFSSFYDARGSIELMRKNNPDLIIEPYVELSDGCEIEISSLGMDKLADCSDGQDSHSLDPEKP
jgi:hypothetical protein